MMGVLHILPQAPVMEPPVVVLANAFLAALNGLRLLAPVTLLRGLATAFGASPANAVDALPEASTKAFLVPLIRSGLIEGGMVLRLVMCNSVSQGNARNEKRKEGFLSQQGCKELAASAHQSCTKQGLRCMPVEASTITCSYLSGIGVCRRSNVRLYLRHRITPSEKLRARFGDT